MTIIDQLIQEAQGIESQVKKAVAARTISGLAGKVLTEECIRSAVAIRHGEIVQERISQDQKKALESVTQ